MISVPFSGANNVIMAEEMTASTWLDIIIAAGNIYLFAVQAISIVFN